MKIYRKSIALIAALSVMLSMSTVALAAETKTISVDGTNLYSVTNVINSYVDTYEDEGEVFHDEVMECEAPAIITVLSKIPDVNIMDHTYEIQNNNDLDTGFIMPDGCPNEKEYWEAGIYRENIAAGTTYTLSEPGTYGINLFFEDGTSYYACIEIAGERTKDAANFTKAYYQDRRENQIDNSGNTSYNTIDINSGKRTETISIWDGIIPNDTLTINGLYGIIYNEYEEPTYVIDTNSTITFNCYLSEDVVHLDENGNSTPFLESDVCTATVYETISYMDNEWYDDGGELNEITQIVPGMTMKFNKVGDQKLFFKMGFASREERLDVQYSKYGWEYAPTMSFKVIDPAPTANYTASKVIVNGIETEFEAYNINDNNYFKLRDVAMAINGTEKQFAVFWDGNKNAISMISNAPYTPVGRELAKGDGTSKSAIMTTSLIYKDEKPVSLSAYNINSNNYFKLRDLGEAFDFDVSWDAANNCIVIDTAHSYTED